MAEQITIALLRLAPAKFVEHHLHFRISIPAQPSQDSLAQVTQTDGTDASQPLRSRTIQRTQAHRCYETQQGKGREKRGADQQRIHRMLLIMRHSTRVPRTCREIAL